MEFKVENGDGIDSWKEVTLVYSAALRQMETKMQILNDEFQHVHQYNPIEHIKARIKTPESIVKKLKRYGQESTIDNMVKYINDIAGIRIICSFTSDIYRIADMIRDQRDIKVIAVKDYITYPKARGYNQNPRNTAFSKHVRFYAICTICFSVSVLFRKIHQVFTSCS